MNKIIAGILSFFLWIMPWWTGLYNARERLAFDRNAVMDKIATCITNRDVGTLESMMRPWFKANVLDLTERLTQFYAAIAGDITSINKGAEGSINSGGIYTEELRFGVYTTDSTYPHYYLLISYDVTNAKNKKDVGISMIRLQTGANSDPASIVHFDLRAPEWT